MLAPKYVMDALRSVGLKRSEVRVRTERKLSGSTVVGYGDTHITLLCPIDRQLALAPELAKYFTVVRYFIDSVPMGGLHVSLGEPCFIEKHVYSERKTHDQK